MRSSPGFWSKTAALAAKDIRIELRGRSTLPPMVAFSLAVALLLGGAPFPDELVMWWNYVARTPVPRSRP